MRLTLALLVLVATLAGIQVHLHRAVSRLEHALNTTVCASPASQPYMLNWTAIRQMVEDINREYSYDQARVGNLGVNTRVAGIDAAVYTPNITWP